VDSLEEHHGDHGRSAADRVELREEFRQMVDDITRLPETQRRALVLREMAGLSYKQLALALEKTVPSVKSLLFRARLGLAEAVEARDASSAAGRAASAATLRDVNRPAVSPIAPRHLVLCERCRCTDHPAHSPNGLASPGRQPARNRIALDRLNTDSSPTRPAADRADSSHVGRLRAERTGLAREHRAKRQPLIDDNDVRALDSMPTHGHVGVRRGCPHVSAPPAPPIPQADELGAEPTHDCSTTNPSASADRST